MTTKPPSIKPILQQFHNGKCFICGEKLELENEDHYAHYECCIAYSDEKDKRIRELYEKSGN